MALRRKKPAKERKEEGPRGWMTAQRKATYAGVTSKKSKNESSLESALESAATVAVPQDVWVDRLRAYKERKVAVSPPAAKLGLEAAFVPGAQNWLPLGPNVLMNGQAMGFPPVGGRVSGLAIARDGLRIYAASANGGVFRSDNGGIAWRSLMDAFDVDPTNFASTSLACGAIAIDPNDPDRIYVGTGEGDTHGMFERRIVHALPAYRGIGAIRSDDGGATWLHERTAAGSPDLAGKAFYALAVDPANREHVIAATTEGIYERVLAAGGAEWVQRRPGIHASAIAITIANATRYYAAETGGGVFRSDDAKTWTPAGTGLPKTDIGRIALAALPDDPRFLYAFVTTAGGGQKGLYRLELTTDRWKKLSGEMLVLTADQGDYDLALAVDPADETTVYIGGSSTGTSPYPAAIARCTVSADGAVTSTGIGEHAHADVHVLVHSPGDANTLWAATDGGVFVHRSPRGTGIFDSRNAGLSCLCPNFVGQHPTDPNQLWCGLQDNGTAHTLGGGIWTRVTGGDGGYCLVNWDDGNQVLVSMNGEVVRLVNGGFEMSKEFGFFLMTYPLAAPPRNPARKADAKLAAVGVVDTIYWSKDFGRNWSKIATIGGEIYSMALSSPKRIYAGLTNGQVFRVDQTSSWKATRIDNVAAGPLPDNGLPISDVAVDTSDPTGKSIYAAIGGMGDVRHVWRFNGTRWESRSGMTAETSLLDVEHNAIAVDPQNAGHVYVGADIGVWKSVDGGASWEPLPNGLPDAPVFDLQVHPTRRLLRAALHGRGIYEWAL
ncbi:MAG TPA: hypothetical protein VEK11_04075 [Thermoanaerobaculia bacterium]|nr:hypothetical protein [Thermoanaerobaculia bacterium]